MTFLSINLLFGQQKTQDEKWKFDSKSGMGITLVQDKIAPAFYVKIGVAKTGYSQLHVTGLANYFFFTQQDGSRSRSLDYHAGVEWLRFIEGSNNEKSTGMGASYCFKNQSLLNEKPPFKIYVVHYVGVFGITAAYNWADFFYPSVSVRFEI